MKKDFWRAYVYYCLVTALNPYIGYDNAAKIAKTKEGKVGHIGNMINTCFTRGSYL